LSPTITPSGDRNANFIRTAQVFLDNNQWGLMKHFAGKNVRELKTQHFAEFINDLATKRPDLSTSTFNMLGATVRNVLKVARDDGVIDVVPDTPRRRRILAMQPSPGAGHPKLEIQITGEDPLAVIYLTGHRRSLVQNTVRPSAKYLKRKVCLRS
jgi:hypothetical protein